MDEIGKAVLAILAAQPARVVLSAPRQTGGGVRRAVVTRTHSGWQLEKLTQDKAFHQNMHSEAALAACLETLLQEHFFQLTAFAQSEQLALRVSKRGKVLSSKRALRGPAAPLAEAAPQRGHNREKRRPLPQGVAIAPLVDIGILTREGRVAAAMQDKWRQINRFVELVDDALNTGALLTAAGQQTEKKLRVVDFGCGKSTLSFVLYYYLTQQGYQVQMTGLDRKADVMQNCDGLARKYGYNGLRFETGDIAQYRGAAADLVMTLHACDTATDEALAQAVRWGSRMIFSAPCCQHELNAQMSSEPLGIVTRYGLVKERAAALFTDVIRANLLGACGYKTQLVEFVGLEHTPKNIMIRAVKTWRPKAECEKLLAEVYRLCETFNLNPCLLRLLRQAGALPPAGNAQTSL